MGLEVCVYVCMCLFFLSDVYVDLYMYICIIYIYIYFTLCVQPKLKVKMHILHFFNKNIQFKLSFNLKYFSLCVG